MKRSYRLFVRRLESAKLRSPVEARALKHHVSLQELYEGPRATSIAAARRDVYTWLISQGKGINEIGRLFDRAPSGVLKMVRKGSVRKARGRGKTL